MPIAEQKRKRVAVAVIFLFGIFASLSALRDSDVWWPPSVVWAGLRAPHRVQLCAGVVMVLMALVIFALRRKQD